MSGDESNKSTQQFAFHVRAGDPAPVGCTHVMLHAAEYEQWRLALREERARLLAQLNSGKLDPFLAEAALEFALLKQLVRDAGTAAMTWKDAQDIGRRAVAGMARIAESAAAAHKRMAALSLGHAALTLALTAMVDRWEPDSAGADRRMWEDACRALGREI